MEDLTQKTGSTYSHKAIANAVRVDGMESVTPGLDNQFLSALWDIICKKRWNCHEVEVLQGAAYIFVLPEKVPVKGKLL